MQPDPKYARLIQMMDIFLSGENRSGNFVREMVGEFVSTGLSQDERFDDLDTGFAMFGAADSEHDENMLAGEFRYALELLRSEQAT